MPSWALAMARKTPEAPASTASRAWFASDFAIASRASSSFCGSSSLNLWTFSCDEIFPAWFHGLKMVSMKWHSPCRPSRISSRARICSGNGLSTTFQFVPDPLRFRIRKIAHHLHQVGAEPAVEVERRLGMVMARQVFQPEVVVKRERRTVDFLAAQNAIHTLPPGQGGRFGGLGSFMRTGRKRARGDRDQEFPSVPHWR